MVNVKECKKIFKKNVREPHSLIREGGRAHRRDRHVRAPASTLLFLAGPLDRRLGNNNPEACGWPATGLATRGQQALSSPQQAQQAEQPTAGTAAMLGGHGTQEQRAALVSLGS